MTQIPDYAHARNGGLAADKRPTTVTVLGIVGMVMAALTVVCSVVSMPTLLMDAAASNPLTAAVRGEPALYRWHVFATVARLALGLVLLVGSLGALGMRRWGRWLMIAYAAVALPVALIELVMMLKYMLPIVERLAPTDPNVQAIAERRHIGVPLRFILDCALPVAVLIFMNRGAVRAAFMRAHASGGTVPVRAGR